VIGVGDHLATAAGGHVPNPSTLPRRRWTSAADLRTSILAAGLACLALTGALLGHRTFVGIPYGALPGAAVLLSGALAASATGRAWGGRHPRAVFSTLVSVAVLSLAGSCFVLLDLIQLVLTGTVTDRGGNSGWTAFGERLAAVAVGALFAASATAWRHRTNGSCAWCGRAHAADVARVEHPAPGAASRRVRRFAYAGCLAFLPYLVLHGLHAAGLVHRFDGLYSDQSILPGPRLLVFAFLAVVLVGPAVFLLLGLVRPWGMRFPRWCLWMAGRRVPRFLPLVPAWVVAPTLALYGTGSAIYAIAAGYTLLGLGGAASLAFGAYGWALAVAAVSYQRRSRPACVPRGEQVSTSVETISP
jgi:hypothetical protein